MRSADLIDAYQALGGLEAILDLIEAGIVPAPVGLDRMREILTELYATVGFDPPSRTATTLARELSRC